MPDTHCKIGKVTYKNNLVALENPLNSWSKEAVEDATKVMLEEAAGDARIDTIFVYMNFSNGEALSYLNRHESCKIPADLIGEVFKQRANTMRHHSMVRDVVFEVLED